MIAKKSKIKMIFLNLFAASRLWLFLLLFKLIGIGAAAKRHVIYWDLNVTPGLRSVLSNHVMNVEIGQFMDILCPQTSLVDIKGGRDQPMTFDLYNVTKPYFDNCSYAAPSNLIFSCNHPEKENKLTIKFQLISPSPLGFRFRYCHHYYLVAVPRDKEKWGSGCQKKSSTRLHINVACKKGTRQSSSTEFFPTHPSSTNILLQKTSDISDEMPPGTVLHPKIVRLNKTTTSEKDKEVKQTEGRVNVLAQVESKHGGNTAWAPQPSSSLISFIFLLAFFNAMAMLIT